MDAALLLDAIGLPRAAFTPVFAIARAPAWIAHALEQQRSRPDDPTGVHLCRAGAGVKLVCHQSLLSPGPWAR